MVGRGEGRADVVVCPPEEGPVASSSFSGDDAGWLDETWLQWLEDPASVDPAWRALFDGLPPEPVNGTRPGELPRFAPRPLFDPQRGRTGVDEASARRAARVVMLTNAWRVRGHGWADIDPLGQRERANFPELDPSWHGLTDADLDAEVPTAPLFGLPAVATVRAVADHLRKVYGGHTGAEFMNILDLSERRWVQEWFETSASRDPLPPAAARRWLRKLSDAENFERLIHNRFPGTKRFSLEGGESVIPFLDRVVGLLAAAGAHTAVLGLAHRGRLNTLVSLMGKPVRAIIDEFQDAAGGTQGSGDVKYHLGYAADVALPGDLTLHLSLTPNPSHLEAVDPVVEGRVRARQDRHGDHDRRAVVPILIHGDAAMAGQGLVMETLNLSELDGYATGGTIHVVINNQIGFTTPPQDSRSTMYCTDIARMLAVPIVHVHGEDPVALADAAAFAVAWRQRFGRDVVIDVVCYRKHGHNEGDEPSFTQPLMYEQIRQRPTPRQESARRITSRVPEAEADAIHRDSQAALVAAADGPRPDPAVLGPMGLASVWAPWRGDADVVPDTGLAADAMRALLDRVNTLPSDFAPHDKIKRLTEQRREVIREGVALDWALGEIGAFASLLSEGHPVRLSGQDSGRGTFSHRHAVVTDVRTGREYRPLSSVGGADLHVVDSSLSEAAVMGFEFGYALDRPEALVIWEAQFGDFVNGAQVILDQFLAASEQKWGRTCGLVLMLPHGYEGQGPEHSSGRLERFLDMAAEGNWTVANLTTPAQLFHALRRQVKRSVRKPLILMTPKSGLRHPRMASPLSDFALEGLRAVLTDPQVPSGARRVVLCSGKVAIDLFDARAKRSDANDVAIVRVEVLAPFPAAEVDAALAAHPGAEVVWCQEEPKNMGAWPSFAARWFDGDLPGGRRPRYVGRPAAAAPATGSHKRHVDEQAQLLGEALSPSTDRP